MRTPLRLWFEHPEETGAIYALRTDGALVRRWGDGRTWKVLGRGWTEEAFRAFAEHAGARHVQEKKGADNLVALSSVR
jgi:hypothetical protein